MRSHSHIHYVLVGGQEVLCRPRGRLRLEGGRILAGDRVEVTLAPDGEGRIDRVLPRASELRRPPVANADLCAVVFTLRDPEADYRFLDRVLVHVEHAGIEAIVVLNKTDLYGPEEVEGFRRLYGEAVGYPVVPVSARTGQGIPELAARLAGRTSVLAGQSGVGKSLLTRALAPGYEPRVGTLARKLGRGRHTTRHVELLRLAGGGLIADAPGFTYLEFEGIEARELGRLFPDFGRVGSCRFDDCLHRAEPDCAVKAAALGGQIVRHRYEHYRVFLDEIEARKPW